MTVVKIPLSNVRDLKMSEWRELRSTFYISPKRKRQRNQDTDYK